MPVLLPSQLMVRGGRGFYRRIWTPLVVLWALIFQRLNADHSCQAAVNHVLSGGADHLDTPHAQPLSQRLRSVSTSAYCQARERLPLEWLQRGLTASGQQIASWLGPGGTWRGHPVALLDGSSVLLRPTPSLSAAYAAHVNQHGPTYWLGLRLLAAFCLGSGALLAVNDASMAVSEHALVRGLLAQLPADLVIVGDRNFGFYRIVQAITHYRQHLVVRLSRRMARTVAGRLLPTHSDCPVLFRCTGRSQAEAAWPVQPVSGRVIHVYLVRPGFRTVDLYLFTTLLDDSRYPLAALVELYGYRWQVEVRLREVKSTLDLELLTAKSPEMARKELYAGLLAYNLVRGAMTQAALRAGIAPLTLSFSGCWRFIHSFLCSGAGLTDRKARAQRCTAMLRMLAQYRLPRRPPNRIEPRAVRRRPAVYPNLKGSRFRARMQARFDLQQPAKS